MQIYLAQGLAASLKQRRRDIFSALKSAFDCMCSIHTHAAESACVEGREHFKKEGSSRKTSDGPKNVKMKIKSKSFSIEIKFLKT